VDIVSTPTLEHDTTSAPSPDTRLQQVPGTVPEFLETTRPRTSRRTTTIVGLTVALLAIVAIVLAIWQPWETTDGTAYTGDWKDSITAVEPAPGGYTGDWKDGITVEPAPGGYTGDWKDGITVEPAPGGYTGDWKDTIG
jgi:hypothetical protein